MAKPNADQKRQITTAQQQQQQQQMRMQYVMRNSNMQRW